MNPIVRSSIIAAFACTLLIPPRAVPASAHPGAPQASQARGEPSGPALRFRMRIENVSDQAGQLASDGARWPFAISPGLWVVHAEEGPLFSAGKKDRGEGLEAQAEDGNPEPLATAVAARKDVRASGRFDVPDGAAAPGPAGPGAAFTFTFEAAPGDLLSFATMFGQSNDLFYAPEEAGFPLFDREGRPLQGDITARVLLWDAGTEVNQEPGVGADQAPRQAAPNTGTAEEGTVRRVEDAYAYPPTARVLRITITPVQQGTR